MEQSIKKILVIILFGIGLSGCMDHPIPNKLVQSDSYVLEYIEYRLLDLSVKDDKRIAVGVFGYDSYGVFSTTEHDIKRFEEKCRQHSDFGYGMDYLCTPSAVYIHCVPERDIVSIDVYSDAPFDSSHPAGTSLADCFYFVSISPYRYIQNGYQFTADMLKTEVPDYYDWPYIMRSLNYYDYYDKRDPEFRSYLPVYGLLSDLDEYDFRMIGICDGWQHWGHESPVPLADLVPAKMPEGRMVHTLTVRIEDTEGFIFKKQIRVDFSE